MSLFALIITICVGQTKVTECNTFIVPEYQAHSLVHARNYARGLLAVHKGEYVGQEIVFADSLATNPDRVLGYVADMIEMANAGKYKHHFKTI